MAKMVTFSVHALTLAQPRAVSALLREGASWPRWSPIGAFELEREGIAGGESPGAIRVFTTGAVRSREELTELRADEALSYVALSGLPIRAHRASVGVTEAEGGTTITWRETFEPRLPGTAWFLRRFVQRCVDGLAAYATEIEAEPGAAC